MLVAALSLAPGTSAVAGGGAPEAGLLRRRPPRHTLVLVVIAVVVGAALLFPWLALTFWLLLHVGCDSSQPSKPARARSGAAGVTAAWSRPPAKWATGCAIAGIGLLAGADSPWADATGVTFLLASGVLVLAALAPTDLGSVSPEEIG
jgi:hypothetical protein